MNSLTDLWPIWTIIVLGLCIYFFWIKPGRKIRLKKIKFGKIRFNLWKTKTTQDPSGAAPSTSSPKKLGFWDVFLNFLSAILLGSVIFVLLAGGIYIMKSCHKTKTEQTKDEQKNETASGFSGTKYDAFLDGKPLTYITSGNIGPNRAWETPVVNYQYLLWTNNNSSYYVQFTSKKGGWTEPVLCSKGRVNRYLPADAKQGKIKVTTLPGENETLEISLYRI